MQALSKKLILKKSRSIKSLKIITIIYIPIWFAMLYGIGVVGDYLLFKIIGFFIAFLLYPDPLVFLEKDYLSNGTSKSIQDSEEGKVLIAVYNSSRAVFELGNIKLKICEVWLEQKWFYYTYLFKKDRINGNTLVLKLDRRIIKYYDKQLLNANKFRLQVKNSENYFDLVNKKYLKFDIYYVNANQLNNEINLLLETKESNGKVKYHEIKLVPNLREDHFQDRIIKGEVILLKESDY